METWFIYKLCTYIGNKYLGLENRSITIFLYLLVSGEFIAILIL